MGYKLDVEYRSPCSKTEDPRPCSPDVTLPYSNGEAKDSLTARMQAAPVDVSLVADDGTLSLDAGTLSQALDGNRVARFPSFLSIGTTALAQAEGHPIRRLRVMIHGTPGQMWFGDHAVDYLYEQSILAGFGPLRGHFAPDGFIELHSCNLAEYPDSPTTDSLISQIALAAGVPVVAAQSTQNAATPWMEGSVETWTPRADGTTTREEEEHTIGDAIMGGVESFVDWLYGGTRP